MIYDLSKNFASSRQAHTPPEITPSSEQMLMATPFQPITLSIYKPSNTNSSMHTAIISPSCPIKLIACNNCLFVVHFGFVVFI